MRKQNQIYHPLIGRILISVCLFMGRLTAQPVVEWDRTIGWEGWEDLNGLQILSDGIITAGSSSSVTSQGRVALNDWSLNVLFVKTDFDGKEIWRKTYGGFDEERLWKVIPTSDGGFLGGGYSKSGIGLEKSQPNRGKEDVWIIKLDAQGNKLWDKTFGGDTTDILYAICELPDGGFMLGCDSYSGANGDKTEPARGDRLVADSHGRTGQQIVGQNHRRRLL